MSQPGLFAPRGGTQAIFVSCAFLGSALLFAIQPIAVRMLLPSLGGSPAVWNAGMVFFQLLLLAGYCYAHWSLRSISGQNFPPDPQAWRFWLAEEQEWWKTEGQRYLELLGSRVRSER